jgi:hypothetical protein
MSDTYCTVDDVALSLGITATSDEEDLLDLHIQAASRWIDTYCRRRFWKDDAATVRTYVPHATYRLDVDDLVSVTTVKSDSSGDGTYETTWATTDYMLGPINADVFGEPFWHIEAVGAYTFSRPGYGQRRDVIAVTGIFGWPEVPSAVKQACVMWAASLFKRRGSPQGSVGGEEFGPIPLLGDRDIERLLDPYRLVTIG